MGDAPRGASGWIGRRALYARPGRPAPRALRWACVRCVPLRFQLDAKLMAPGMLRQGAHRADQAEICYRGAHHTGQFRLHARTARSSDRSSPIAGRELPQRPRRMRAPPTRARAPSAFDVDADAGSKDVRVGGARSLHSCDRGALRYTARMAGEPRASRLHSVTSPHHMAHRRVSGHYCSARVSHRSLTAHSALSSIEHCAMGDSFTESPV